MTIIDLSFILTLQKKNNDAWSITGDFPPPFNMGYFKGCQCVECNKSLGLQQSQHRQVAWRGLP
jgi:hypothetical protein